MSTCFRILDRLVDLTGSLTGGDSPKGGADDAGATRTSFLQRVGARPLDELNELSKESEALARSVTNHKCKVSSNYTFALPGAMEAPKGQTAPKDVRGRVLFDYRELEVTGDKYGGMTIRAKVWIMPFTVFGTGLRHSRKAGVHDPGGPLFPLLKVPTPAGRGTA